MPRWSKIFLCVLAVLALAVATLPWWLGAAARPVLGRWAITLKNYEPAGYGGFRVEEVRFARGNTTVVDASATSAPFARKFPFKCSVAWLR